VGQIKLSEKSIPQNISYFTELPSAVARKKGKTKLSDQSADETMSNEKDR
jgi:hypothetical protein